MGQLCSKEVKNGNKNNMPQEQEENIVQQYPEENERHVSTNQDATQDGHFEPSSFNSQMQKYSTLSFEEVVDLYTSVNLSKKVTVKNFKKHKVLGKGGFGKVFLVEYDKNGEKFAMKSIIKENIDEGLEKYMAQEKFILQSVKHPFIVKLNYAFQTPEELFLVLEFCQAGELLSFLKKHKLFGEKTAIFYMVQLILTFEFLHKRQLIYRDLKPQNILIDSEGYMKLTDFGLSKLLKGEKVTYTLCGSKQFIAPEIFVHEGYNQTADYFNLGIVFYMLLTGQYIYYQHPEKDRIKKVLAQEPLKYPEGTSSQTKDIIKRLLNPVPQNRLGANGIKEIKEHPVFKNINWSDVYNKKIVPPFKPQFTSDLDLKYFDEKYTCQPIKDDSDEIAKMDIYRQFSYNKDEYLESEGFRNTLNFIELSKMQQDENCLQPIEDFAKEYERSHSQNLSSEQNSQNNLSSGLVH